MFKHDNDFVCCATKKKYVALDAQVLMLGLDIESLETGAVIFMSYHCFIVNQHRCFPPPMENLQQRAWRQRQFRVQVARWGQIETQTKSKGEG